MKNERTCTYLRREEALVTYLYDEGGDPAGRVAFESHLEGCSVCCAELEAFQGVRGQLAAWAPPEPLYSVRRGAASTEPTGTGPTARMWASLAEAPWWAQAAAAVVCVGVGVGAANLRMTRGPEGLTVRTGWLAPDREASNLSTTVARPPDVDRAALGPALAALERELRAEMRQLTVAQPAVTPVVDVDGVLRQTRALIAQSEQRQQRELALRMGDLLSDVQTQRLADLSKIDRSLGVIQNSTGIEVLRQREMLNSLAVRVSQRQ